MKPVRLITIILGANIAGGLISLGLGSALISLNVNFFQAGLILLGIAINLSVGTAMTIPPPLVRETPHAE